MIGSEYSDGSRAVREDLVDPLLEMFHHQVVLLLSVFVLCFWLKSAKFTSLSLDIFINRNK